MENGISFSDTLERGLAKHGQLLRIRTETPAAISKKSKSASGQRTLLTFKRPLVDGASPSGSLQENHRHKVREEFELQVTDAAVLTTIFEGLGMRGWFRYEKYRTTFRLPTASHWAKGLLVELDETPIGTFVELEGPPWRRSSPGRERARLHPARLHLAEGLSRALRGRMPSPRPRTPRHGLRRQEIAAPKEKIKKITRKVILFLTMKRAGLITASATAIWRFNCSPTAVRDRMAAQSPSCQGGFCPDECRPTNSNLALVA